MNKLTTALLAGFVFSTTAPALAMDFKEDCLGPREETASTPATPVATAEPAKPAPVAEAPAPAPQPATTATAEIPAPKPAAN